MYSARWLVFVVCGLFYIETVCVYLLLRSKRFYDQLHILDEFYMLGICMSVIAIPWTMLVVSMKMFEDLEDGTENYSDWRSIVLFSISQLMIVYDIWTIYIQTRYVMNKVETDPAIIHEYGKHLPQKLAVKPASPEEERTSTIQQSSKTVTLDQILSDSDHFSCFMTHLSTEFSMECMLSLIEFIQFKQAIHKNINTMTTDRFLNIQLPDCVPKSSIVYNDDDADSFEKKAYKLFKKYVEIGSEYEINICYAARRKLTERFQGKSNLKEISSEDLENLCCVFDDCCKEMMTLLGYSLRRFKNKPECLRLQNLKK